MTKEEAIADLEARKKMLQSTCMNCWDEAIEMALQALKKDVAMKNVSCYTDKEGSE